MPRRDGTGPMGMGSMTGRGLGACAGVNAPVYGGGFRRGCGRGFGQGFGRGLGPRTNLNYNYNQPAPKEVLQAQKEQLKAALDAIEIQIEGL